jgi:predicted RNase H-like HicB family nuclease/predicted RNA binding protein YcfA (HicA-like mRNA interferase family)
MSTTSLLFCLANGPAREPLRPDAGIVPQLLADVGFTRLCGRRSWAYSAGVTFMIEPEREADGRWLAEVPTLPRVLCCGQDRDEAVAKVQALALRVIAERLEHREAPAEFLNVTFESSVSNWPASRARRVLAALLRLGWAIKRQSGSHRTLAREGGPMSCLRFTTTKRSGRGCSRGSPSTPGSARTISRDPSVGLDCPTFRFSRGGLIIAPAAVGCNRCWAAMADQSRRRLCHRARCAKKRHDALGGTRKRVVFGLPRKT